MTFLGYHVTMLTKYTTQCLEYLRLVVLSYLIYDSVFTFRSAAISLFNSESSIMLTLSRADLEPIIDSIKC